MRWAQQERFHFGVSLGHAGNLAVNSVSLPCLKGATRIMAMPLDEYIEGIQKGRYPVAASLRAREEAVKLPLLLVRIVLS